MDDDVLEGHDDGDLRKIHGCVGNPKIASKRSNQPLDEDELFAKATKDSGGRNVNKMEIPQDANLDVNVPEGHDNVDLRMIRGGVGNPKLGSERSNQLLDEEESFAKATENFTAQQRRR